MTQELYLYNSFTRKKALFVPLNEREITMYVCGPTVYDTPHIGNMRAVVVYDMLYRILRMLYPRVKYVRNITDVDDKIIDKAIAKKELIYTVAERYYSKFTDHCAYLNCLTPTFSPKATEHIPEMIAMITKLIELKKAYVTHNNEVYFAVNSYEAYGKLSGRSIAELLHKDEVNHDKKSPHDFALWKRAERKEQRTYAYWHSPWGKGRPGWHIECSAMSTHYLGKSFDIHGGGADLKFPHHENEIAQTCSAYPHACFARYWIHNGFVTVNAEKMSKSLGNVLTIDKLRKQGIRGEVIRYALLSTHYRKPLDWNTEILNNAQEALYKLYSALDKYGIAASTTDKITDYKLLDEEFVQALLNDMNTPLALMRLHKMIKEIDTTGHEVLKNKFLKSANLLGLLSYEPQKWFISRELDVIAVTEQVQKRKHAKARGDFATADKIRAELAIQGVELQDNRDNETWWKVRKR